jgi:hypothetical protein
MAWFVYSKRYDFCPKRFFSQSERLEQRLREQNEQHTYIKQWLCSITPRNITLSNNIVIKLGNQLTVMCRLCLLERNAIANDHNEMRPFCTHLRYYIERCCFQGHFVVLFLASLL